MQKTGGIYEPAKAKGMQGKQEKSTLDEILEKINERYKGNFTEGDKVMLNALHDKLILNEKLAKSARTSDPTIFVESIFPAAFGDAAIEGYMEAQESYSSLLRIRTNTIPLWGCWLAWCIVRCRWQELAGGWQMPRPYMDNQLLGSG